MSYNGDNFFIRQAFGSHKQTDNSDSGQVYSLGATTFPCPLTTEPANLSRPFSFPGTTNTHKEAVSSVQMASYLCSDCGKQFKGRHSLVSHQQYHCPMSDQKRGLYVCDYCGRTLWQKSRLVKHIMMNHATDTEYPQPAPLKQSPVPNVSIEHGNNRFSEKELSKKQKYQGSKPAQDLTNNFDCPDCGKHFKRRQNMKWHRVHHCKVSGPKPGRCICEFCGKILWQKDRLEKHIAFCHSSNNNNNGATGFGVGFSAIDLSPKGTSVLLAIGDMKEEKTTRTNDCSKLKTAFPDWLPVPSTAADLSRFYCHRCRRKKLFSNYLLLHRHRTRWHSSLNRRRVARSCLQCHLEFRSIFSFWKHKQMHAC